MRVVLTILDGMPARHVGPAVTPVLSALAAEGTGTVGRSVMTSATYPNHATFVTGATPLEHGLLANWVIDGDRPRPAHHVGPRVPTLFDACATAGRRTAAVLGDHHLVGVMAAHRADHHWPPDGKIPAGAARDRYDYVADDEIVRQVGALVSEPWDLIVVHLNEPDTAGHIDGPDSAAASVSYQATDTALGRIAQDLRPDWDDTVLVVLSDHDQREVDETLTAVELTPGDGLIAIPEGSASIIWGDDPADGEWLDAVDGVAGHELLRPGVRMAWAAPGRVFALPAGFGDVDLRGHHGGADTRDQVVVVAGGHPDAAALAAAASTTTPAAEDWAPTIAALLGVDLAGTSGRSML